MSEIAAQEIEESDERVSLPESFFLHLEEAINDHYGKVVEENTQLVTSHKDGITPTAVYRLAYEAQVKRIGEAGMLMQWFREGFRIE